MPATAAQRRPQPGNKTADTGAHDAASAIKTDSFVIPNEKLNEFEQKYKLGNELGEFKVEYEATSIKYTSASCYKADLVDGSIRMRGKVN